jgi:hypothetical protein
VESGPHHICIGDVSYNSKSAFRILDPPTSSDLFRHELSLVTSSIYLSVSLLEMGNSEWRARVMQYKYVHSRAQVVIRIRDGRRGRRNDNPNSGVAYGQ